MRRRSWYLSVLGAALIASIGALASGPNGSPTRLFAAPAANGPALSVDASANRQAISPDIYGITFFWSSNTPQADYAFAQAIHLPVNRDGGDATTRYNWKLDSSNAGQDWYFTAGNGETSPAPSGSANAIIDGNRTVGAKTVLTVPIIEYINGDSRWHCSFPKSTYGAQQSYNPYVHPYNNSNDQCGNGYSTSGAALTETNPLNSDIANSPAFQQQWVQYLVNRYGSAANGGVPIYELDNEPSGWLYMHRDVHPQGVGYTELRNLFYGYAAAIKSADPSAEVLGPGDIPWAAYDCNNCGNDGAAAHGGTPFGEWLLQQMAAYQRQHGVRLLDYYSMHYPGAYGGDQIQAAASHIQTFQGWINAAYPGTKLAFDEYNWGNAQPFSSALTTADGLGMFGREGVSLASYWGLDNVTWPTAYAFRMYRDYDGAGGMYGDTAVAATSADAGQLTIYGAQRSSDGALTLMVINKSGAPLTSNLSLAGYTPAATAQMYTYSSANQSAIVQQPNLPVTASGFTATYPANSISMVVLSPATPTPTATAKPKVTATATHHGAGSATGANGTSGGARGGSSHGAAPWLLTSASVALIAGAAFLGVFMWRRRRRRDGGGQPGGFGGPGGGPSPGYDGGPYSGAFASVNHSGVAGPGAYAGLDYSGASPPRYDDDGAYESYADRQDWTQPQWRPSSASQEPQGRVASWGDDPYPPPDQRYDTWDEQPPRPSRRLRRVERPDTTRHQPWAPADGSADSLDWDEL